MRSDWVKLMSIPSIRQSNSRSTYIHSMELGIKHMYIKIKGLILVGFFLSFNLAVSHAAVFSIVPKAGTSLPTKVTSGNSINAFYTVTNTTGRAHTGCSKQFYFDVRFG